MSSSENSEKKTEFYDVVLNLESLSRLKEGFSVEYTEKGKKKIEDLKKNKGIVITAIGNSNQGKSYILSKISDINIPKGHSINTKGLSIAFPDNLTDEKDKDTNKRYIILDTEGSQNAITISDDDRNEIYKLNEEKKIEKIESASRDRQITENFLQNLALYSANIVIAVVGQLTFQDQKFLNRIKEQCKKKSLYIIHNLMFLETKENVRDHMKDVIEKSLFFNVRKQTMTELSNKNTENMNTDYYVETIDDAKNYYVIHLIMAREGTEAGNYYNKSTIDFLRKTIAAYAQQKKFDVFKSFGAFLCLNVFDYFDLPIELNKEENVEKKKNDQIKEENNDDINTNMQNEEENKKDGNFSNFDFIKLKDIELDNNNIMKVNTKYPLNLKKCLIDEIGITTYKGLTTTPSYCYFKTQNKFIIQIEFCGKLETIKIKKNSLGGQYKFRIYGKTNKYNKKVMYSNIEEGDFILTFPVGLDFITISNNTPIIDPDEKNGIVNISYDIAQKSADDEDSGEDIGDL